MNITKDSYIKAKRILTDDEIRITKSMLSALGPSRQSRILVQLLDEGISFRDAWDCALMDLCDELGLPKAEEERESNECRLSTMMEF